jgi:hypothetical protein
MKGGAVTGEDRIDRHQKARGFLEVRGAAVIAHPGGTLLAHLQRTAGLLADWGASEKMVLGGLCHASYGTDGFDTSLLDISARAHLAGVIGSAAESIVYFYASCDRRFTYPEFAGGGARFRDRFTGEATMPEPDQLRQFAELTFANELDIARHSPAFRRNAWSQLAPLFSRCEPLVSNAAWQAYLAAYPPEMAATAVPDSNRAG